MSDSENKIELRAGQTALVERLAVNQENAGLQPAPAKVFALLMVSDKPQLTFDEIQETLGISKSATSGAINQLLTLRRIEYVTRLGDRKRYFKPRISNIQQDISVIAQHLTSTTTIYQEILKQRPADTTEHNDNMRLMIDFQKFIAHELPELVEKFQRKRK